MGRPGTSRACLGPRALACLKVPSLTAGAQVHGAAGIHLPPAPRQEVKVAVDAALHPSLSPSLAPAPASIGCTWRSHTPLGQALKV